MSDWKKHLNPSKPTKNRNLRIKRRHISPTYTPGKYDWELTEKDFKKGEKILEGELLTNLVSELNEENTFEALVFCMLAQRQRYDLQVELYRNMKLSGLMDPKKIIKEEEQLIRLFRRDASLYRQKYKNISSSAEFWINTDYPERLVSDANTGYNNGDELRDELVEKVHGVGYKTASLFMLKVGYEDFVTFDVWLTRWMHHKELDKELGINFIETKGQVPDYLYKKAEKLTMKVAEEEYSQYNLTPAMLTAVLWGKHAKWSQQTKESYIRTVANHTKCSLDEFE